MLIKRAMFPISLSNQRYSTDFTTDMLRKIPNHYDEILFIIADQLQLYNKALHIKHSSLLGEVIGKFQREQRYLLERQTWLNRLKLRFSDDQTSKWHLSGLNDFMDSTCFKIFRNVMLAYYSLSEFRKDLDFIAYEHANIKNSEYPWTQRMLLSRGYILEELALSIRIKLLGGVHDEFYVDRHPDPLIKLYNGKYNFSVYDIAQTAKSVTPFRFYHFIQKDENLLWREQKLD